MGINDPEKTIEELSGEVHALFMFLQVLARTNSHPSLVLSQFEKASHQRQTFLEQHPINDSTISAFQDAVKSLQEALLANPQYSPESHQ